MPLIFMEIYIATIKMMHFCYACLPSDTKPAKIKEMRCKSAAETSAPCRFSPSIKTEALQFSHQIHTTEFFHMHKAIFKTVSVILRAFAVNINAIISDCISVGKPGCGIVLISTAFKVICLHEVFHFLL